MSNELKDCPFCGAKPVMETYQTLVSIRCDPCGVARAFRGPLSGARTEPLHTGSIQCRFTHPQEDYSHQAIEDAVAAWNSRAAIAYQPPKATLTDEQIKEIIFDVHANDGMGEDIDLMKLCRAIEAAAAPNAKLVAALRDMLTWFGQYPELVPDESHYKKYRAAIDNGRAALSAVGEVQS